MLDERGDRVEVDAAPPDADGLRGLVDGLGRRHGPVAVRAAIESMNGARFVHDTLEREGWEVEVADEGSRAETTGLVARQSVASRGGGPLR